MNYKHLLIAAVSGAFLLNGNVNAQSQNIIRCYTDEHNQELELKNPGLAKNRQEMEDAIQRYISANTRNNKIAGPVMHIPTVVHVVTEKGLNGISKAQVLNGIEVLNVDFRRLNPDAINTRPQFQPYAADLEVQFDMARIDPNGEPTEGIVRTTSFTTNGPITRDDVKAASPAWPTDKYFNVWLVQVINSSSLQGGGTILGYAQFPGTNTWNTYGLVMLHNQWGKVGAVPGTTANGDGRTATHEAGHCFNLYHTFQGGCGSTNCQTSGDLVCDTPPSAAASYGCSTNGKNSCQPDASFGVYSGDQPDQQENYMSYDDCQNMFSLGQRTRAQAALNTISQLVNLHSQSNAVATGIDPTVVVGPLKPMPYFGVSSDRVCTGTPFTITDASYDGVATSYLWTFPGGTPATSTDQNPTVTYANPGKYAVTLTTGNAAGSRSVTVNNFVTVSANTNLATAGPGNQFVESFETSSFAPFPTNVTPNRSFEITTTKAGSANFEITPAASTTGNYSLRIRNASIAEGTISSLITPNINISAIPSNLYLSFDMAYARKTATPGEILKIFVSTDCGNNWAQRKVLSGTQLITNGGNIVNGTFTPSASEWVVNTTNILPNSLLTAGQLMFKIEVTSALGNTLYIDNLKVYTILGTNEELAAQNSIKVYPNPLTTESGISFELSKSEKVSVKIFDLVGNMVYEGAPVNMASGSHTINLFDKTKNLSAGMYMLQLGFGNKVYNTKLLSK